MMVILFLIGKAKHSTVLEHGLVEPEQRLLLPPLISFAIDSGVDTTMMTPCGVIGGSGAGAVQESEELGEEEDDEEDGEEQDVE